MIEFSGATMDSRQVKPGMLFVALKGEKTDGREFVPQARAAGAAGVIEGLDALREFAREYRRSLRARVIGVTGSAGKTTTKELLRAFLSRAGRTHATAGNYNNHIGLPLTILNCPKDADFLVLEMGSNHPGEIRSLCEIAAPDAGVVTNVGTAHLEFFRTQDGIAEEKGTLFEFAREFAVAHPSNVRFDALRARCVRAEFVAAGDLPPELASALARVLPGTHNAVNASIAFAAASRWGVTAEDATAALEGFELPGARCRRTVLGGVTFIDDTYNANPDAMVAALETLAAMPCGGRRVAVLGDMFELGENSEALHRRVFERARSLGLGLVVGVGKTASRCSCDRAFATLAELEAAFAGLVAPGDTVLLKASHAMGLGGLLEGFRPIAGVPAHD